MTDTDEQTSLEAQISDVRAQVAAIASNRLQGVSPLPRVFIAKSTSAGVFAEAVVNAGATALETPAGLRAGVASGFSKLLDLSILDPDGIVVLEIPYAGGHRYVLVSGSAVGMRRVYLTMDGGSAGTSLVQCSYTYTLKDKMGTTLATAVAMTGNGRRDEIGVMSPGTVGIAYQDGADWILIYADETEDTSVCGAADLVVGF